MTSGDFGKYDVYNAVIVSFVAWSLLYRVCRTCLSDKSAEYSCRMITLVHGLTISICGMPQCFAKGLPFYHPEWNTTYKQIVLLATSLGYFIHDLCWSLYHKTETNLMIAHHFLTIFALLRMLLKEYSGAQTICCLATMEVTNPLLQSRWFLRTEGFYPSILFTCVEFLFIALFFFVRIIWHSYILTKIYKQTTEDWDFLILSIIMYLISWGFFLQIINYSFGKYVSNKKIKSQTDIKTIETT